MMKNQIKNQFMSSQTFHRTSCGCVRETTIWERLRLKNLELFNPVAQESHRLQPVTIQITIHANLKSNSQGIDWLALPHAREESQRLPGGTHSRIEAGALATSRIIYSTEENRALTTNKRRSFNGLPSAKEKHGQKQENDFGWWSCELGGETLPK
jgi:hypothetical protein